MRPRHAVENQWDLLAPIDVPAPSADADPVEMPVDPRAAATIAARLQAAGVPSTDRLVVVHVSAGNPFRRWPQDSFAELVADARLPARGRAGDRRVRAVGTGTRRRPSSRVRAMVDWTAPSDDRVLSIGECSLAELRALFDRAALFIGGDSGPLHIAATSAIPIVGLYGPTLPVRSAPWRAGR